VFNQQSYLVNLGRVFRLNPKQRNQQKAMFAKINKNRFAENESLKQMMRDGDNKRLENEFGSYQKKYLYYDNKRLEKHRGVDMSLVRAIQSNDYMDKRHVWTFHKGIAIHPTDRGNESWNMYPLQKKSKDFFIDHNGNRKELEQPITKYYVNDTNIDNQVLGEVARYAKKQGLLQIGSIAELQMKGKFEAIAFGSNKPIAIKLGQNTFMIAPRLNE